MRHWIGIGGIAWCFILATGCDKRGVPAVATLANDSAAYEQFDLHLVQELVNDAPLGPGMPQPSDHCPTGPGDWFAGSGRSTGTSNVFGDLTEVEVYCINRGSSQLSDGRAKWVDVDGDTIFMNFGATLLRGFVYTPSPNAPMIGSAHFVRGTGKWKGITGAALFTGKQNGDGSATVEYRGAVYLPG
jgi:hypothetical protein